MPYKKKKAAPKSKAAIVRQINVLTKKLAGTSVKKKRRYY